jgi:methylated-DNA-protein-cysteine methyltransferase related protein
VDARTHDLVSVIVALVPGEVTTYGDVAEVAGHPGRARLVGRILASGGDADGEVPELPWWRVVNATGRLVPGHEHDQAGLLRREGVDVRNGRVVRAPVGRFSGGPVSRRRESADRSDP